MTVSQRGDLGLEGVVRRLAHDPYAQMKDASGFADAVTRLGYPGREWCQDGPQMGAVDHSPTAARCYEAATSWPALRNRRGDSGCEVGDVFDFAGDANPPTARCAQTGGAAGFVRTGGRAVDSNRYKRTTLPQLSSRRCDRRTLYCTRAKQESSVTRRGPTTRPVQTIWGQHVCRPPSVAMIQQRRVRRPAFAHV